MSHLSLVGSVAGGAQAEESGSRTSNSSSSPTGPLSPEPARLPEPPLLAVPRVRSSRGSLAQPQPRDPASGQLAVAAQATAAESDVDSKIRQLIIDGDRRAAVAMMMREYEDVVYSNAYRIIGNRAIASDALQQTFLEALRDLARFGGRSSVKTWLLGIGSHRAIDLARKVRREEKWRGAEEEGAEIPETTAPEVPAALDQRRRISALEDCLRGVSPKVRAALLSRYQHSLSYEEIAESCGEKPGTLQARVTRALPVLRRCLEGKGVES